MKTTVDLGWLNAGGETRRRIDIMELACRKLRHTRTETNEGMNGTTHTVTCNDCGYSYQYDSGD